MKGHLEIEYTSPDQGAEDYAWRTIVPEITKLLERGATSGKFSKSKTVPDGYGGGSEVYFYDVKWKLEES